MSEVDVLQARLLELRAEFDESFSRANRHDASELVELLHITVAEQAFAVALSELRGLHPVTTIAALPSRDDTLLGLCAMRGVTFAVHDLAAMLGYARSVDPQWLFIARDAPVAFAFSQLRAHQRVASDAIVSTRDAGAFMRAYWTRAENDRCGVIDVNAMVKRAIATGG